MLRPSYAELIEVLNNDMKADSKITSRYTIVIAAAKRARQLIEGAVPLMDASTDKAVSIAVNELYSRKLHIQFPSEEELALTGYGVSDQINIEEMMEEYGD